MRKRNPSPRLSAAVGVSFQNGGKVYFFEPNNIAVEPGEHVLAKTERGVDIGEVVLLKYKLDPKDDEKALKPLLRRATRDDLLREDILRRRARAALRTCEKKVEEHGLPMKLISADYTFDGQRLIFYFSSETRVDFRALVRDLAETFGCRIELRQIGVRDEAKMIGGLGPCGRPLCCAQWLRNFSPVGIRVAKDQGMSLNPAKISGVCDRLMCCLLYEHEVYTDLADRLPRVGDEVRGQGLVGKVRQVSLLRERVTISVDAEDTRETIEVPGADLRRSKGYWRLLGTQSVKNAPSDTPPPAAPPPADERPPRAQPRPPRRTERAPRREETQATEQPATVTMREPRRSLASQAPPPKEAEETAALATEERPKSRRRPPRRRARTPEGAQSPEQAQGDTPQAKPKPPADAASAGDQPQQPRRSRSRRRPGGARRAAGEQGEQTTTPSGKQAPDKPQQSRPEGGQQPAGEGQQQPKSRRRTWRRRPGKSGSGDSGSGGQAPSE
jgi:cell fate regulator YaaT (PSP1 superfamily)